MIELDRRGKNDCVFYDCCNREFIEYIEKFGFVEEWGSFSDISFLMGAWEICATNLSVGYLNEHSAIETLNAKDLFDTIEKVKIMLQEEIIPEFDYEEYNYNYNYHTFLKSGLKDYGVNDIFGQHCSGCKQLYSEYELFPAKGADGKTKYFCPDCIVGKVEWCEYCGEPFEICGSATEKICKECADNLCMKTSSNNSAK
jgi:hypothetical protein